MPMFRIGTRTRTRFCATPLAARQYAAGPPPRPPPPDHPLGPLTPPGPPRPPPPNSQAPPQNFGLGDPPTPRLPADGPTPSNADARSRPLMLGLLAAALGVAYVSWPGGGNEAAEKRGAGSGAE